MITPHESFCSPALCSLVPFYHRTLRSLAERVRIIRRVEYRAETFLFRSLVLEHLVIHTGIVALNRKRRFRCLGLDDKVVVAMGAVFVAVVKFLGVFAEAFFALFASKYHFK